MTPLPTSSPAARASLATLATCAALLAGCHSPLPSDTPPARSPAATARVPAPAPVARAVPERPAADMLEVRRRAAQKIVQANPSVTYTSKAPADLLAIQVLEIELNADGSVHRIDVIRRSEYGPGTIDIAKAAIHKAAPFSDVRHLKKPWTFTETFLFDEDRRFKPRILD